jgi:hypothetical protein
MAQTLDSVPLHSRAWQNEVESFRGGEVSDALQSLIGTPYYQAKRRRLPELIPSKLRPMFPHASGKLKCLRSVGMYMLGCFKVQICLLPTPVDLVLSPSSEALCVLNTWTLRAGDCLTPCTATCAHARDPVVGTLFRLLSV